MVILDRKELLVVTTDSLATSGMTDRDIEIYNCIGLYIAQKGYAPTVSEICGMTGLKSTSTVHGRLKKLEGMGKIKRLAESPRTIVIV